MIFLLPAVFWDIYHLIQKWQPENNKIDDEEPPEPTLTPINPPDKPNPPDLASAQFNEFMKKTKKEKVPRE